MFTKSAISYEGCLEIGNGGDHRDDTGGGYGAKRGELEFHPSSLPVYAPRQVLTLSTGCELKHIPEHICAHGYRQERSSRPSYSKHHFAAQQRGCATRATATALA